MKKYKVQITETLQRIIEVPTSSKEEAYEKILRAYQNGDIVLDYEDFIDKEIIVSNKSID